MPLKKILKRRQNCDNPNLSNEQNSNNISALIISSGQNSNETEIDSVDLSVLPMSTEVPSTSAGWSTYVSQNALDEKSNFQLVPTKSSQLNPLPPPLVSVVKSLMCDSSPSKRLSDYGNNDSFCISSSIVGENHHENWQARQPSKVQDQFNLRDYINQVSTPNSQSYNNLFGNDNRLPLNRALQSNFTNSYYENLQGCTTSSTHGTMLQCCVPDTNKSKYFNDYNNSDFTESTFPNKIWGESEGPFSKSSRQNCFTQMQRSDMSTSSQNQMTKKLKLSNRMMSMNNFNVTQPNMTNSGLPDIRFPIVKQPLMPPISPESNRIYSRRSNLISKKQGSLYSTKSRKISEKIQQTKGVEDYLINLSNIDESNRPSGSFNQTIEEDDDVIITGVVNLNQHDRNEFVTKKMSKSHKMASKQKAKGCTQMDENAEINHSAEYKRVSNRPRKYNKRGTGRKSNRGRPRLACKMAAGLMSDNMIDTYQDTYSDKYSHNTNLGRYQKKIKAGHYNEPHIDYMTHPNISYSKEKNNNSGTFQNHATPHSSTMNLRNIYSSNSVELQKGNNLQKFDQNNQPSTDDKTPFDWRACLTLFDDQTNENSAEVVEIGSATDSDEDDTILRDLSEFLMLSEDRRISSKKPIDPDSRILNTDKLNLDNLIKSEIRSAQSNKLKAQNFTNPDGPWSNCYKFDSNESVIKQTVENSEKYSSWHSLFDNYPKPSNFSNKYKNTNPNNWKKYLLSDRDPMLSDSEHYNVESTFINRDKCLEEFINGAGYIIKSEPRKLYIHNSDIPREKRIYRKKIKLPYDDVRW